MEDFEKSISNQKQATVTAYNKLRQVISSQLSFVKLHLSTSGVCVSSSSEFLGQDFGSLDRMSGIQILGSSDVNDVLMETRETINLERQCQSLSQGRNCFNAFLRQQNENSHYNDQKLFNTNQLTACICNRLTFIFIALLKYLLLKARQPLTYDIHIEVYNSG